MTAEWKWVRVHAPVHARLTEIKDTITAERIQRERARSAVNYDEIIELALNALERERNNGMDTDRPGRIPGDAGRGHLDRRDT